MDYYYYLYYIESNLICVFVLGLVLFRLFKYEAGNKTDSRVFKSLIISVMLFCLADLFSGLFKGRNFVHCNTILYLTNSLYLITSVIVGYFWMKYVYVKFGEHGNWIIKKWWIWQIPLIVFAIIIIINPYTHFLFYIQPQEIVNGEIRYNIYHRGSGIFVHWIITYCYIIMSTVKIIMNCKKEKNYYKRQTMLPFSFFIIFPVICSITQIVVPIFTNNGITSIQVGFTLSCLLIFMRSQQDQISNDELTGLNNRRELDRYLTDKMNGVDEENNVFLLMIDIDRFKAINDTYGHIVGDEALIFVSYALKNAVGKFDGEVFIARYGGDEFVICGINKNDDEICQIKQLIHDEVFKIASENNLDYKLEVSIGYMTGKKSDFPTPTDLFIAADKMMYYNKNKKR